MTVFSRHPVDNPVITQPWGANRTGGITPNPNGTDMQRIVAEYGNYQEHGHDGIDYGCPIGTPVYAPADGVVDYAGWGQDMPQWVADKYASVAGPGGWPSGIITFLDHGPIGSYVAHKSESYMDNRVGERISAGTLLGLSGTTGRSGGPHVHFSAIRFPVNYSDPLYSRVNPLDYFSTVTVTPIRPGNTGAPSITEEDDMSAADVSKILKDIATVHETVTAARNEATNAKNNGANAARVAQVAANEATNAKVVALDAREATYRLEAAVAEIATNPGITPEALREALGKITITLTTGEAA